MLYCNKPQHGENYLKHSHKSYNGHYNTLVYTCRCSLQSVWGVVTKLGLLSWKRCIWPGICWPENLPQPLISIISVQFTFQWLLEGWFLNDICPSDVAFHMLMNGQWNRLCCWVSNQPIHTNTHTHMNAHTYAQLQLFPQEAGVIFAPGCSHNWLKDRQLVPPLTPAQSREFVIYVMEEEW